MILTLKKEITSKGILSPYEMMVDYGSTVSHEFAKAYNLKIKRFPTNLMAGMFGYGQRDYFEASEQSKEVPNVNFD